MIYFLAENKPAKELKKTRVMEGFMDNSGSAVKEVNLKNGDKWVKHHVYVVKGLDEVLGVEVELEEL